MRYARLVASSVLLLALIMWAGGCGKQLKFPDDENLSIPEYDAQLENELYHEMWQECESELDLCVKTCDQFAP